MNLLILAPPAFDAFWLAALAPILADPRIVLVGAVVDARPPTPIVTQLIRHLRKGRGGYVAVMAVKHFARPLATRTIPAARFLRQRGIDVREVTDLYADDTLAYVKSKEPDCMFRCGFGIIREPVLSMAPKGVISYHHGNLRRYRGLPPAFWELKNGEREMGVTVQILAEELDAGQIVVERTVPIRATDSWRSLERRAFQASEDMLHEACRRLAEPGFTPTILHEDELGALYTLPNLRQWVTLQAKVLGRKALAVGSRAR